MLWLLLALSSMVGGGVLVAWAYKASRRPAPPLDIPTREELCSILDVCIGLKIANQDYQPEAQRFLAGCAYWRAKDTGMTEKDALDVAVMATDADLDIRMVNDG